MLELMLVGPGLGVLVCATQGIKFCGKNLHVLQACFKFNEYYKFSFVETPRKFITA